MVRQESSSPGSIISLLTFGLYFSPDLREPHHPALLIQLLSFLSHSDTQNVPMPNICALMVHSSISCSGSIFLIKTISEMTASPCEHRSTSGLFGESHLFASKTKHWLLFCNANNWTPSSGYFCGNECDSVGALSHQKHIYCAFV